MTYRAPEHMINNTRACVDLWSRFPCSEVYEFPKPEDLSEYEAYRKVSGASVELTTYTNSMVLSYERKLCKVSMQLVEYESQLKEFESMKKEFESVKKEAGKVPELEAKKNDLIQRLDDTNKVVQDLRSQKKDIGEQLELANAQKESLQAQADRLRKSRASWVRNTVEDCNKRLGGIKRSIDDSLEVARLSGLMSQAEAIKDYLIKMGKEDGITIPEARLKALDENFKIFEGQLNALGDVEEADDEDFVMPLPDWLSAVAPQVAIPLAQVETAPSQAEVAPLVGDEYGTQHTPADRIREQLETEAALVIQKSGHENPGLRAVDHVTGEKLADLDGLPVTQAPSAALAK